MAGNGSVVPLWIDGEEVQSQTQFDVASPTTGEKLWKASSASLEHVETVTAAAQTAFKTWRKTKPATRRQILLKAADIMAERRAELKQYHQQETGALDQFATFIIDITIDMCRDVAGRVSTILGAIPEPAAPGTGAFVFKEPFGVVLGIAPWNAPYCLGLRAFIFAIATGNTVILKGSELCPRTFWALGSVFRDAGLPKGVLNIIYHQPSDAVAVTNALIESPVVKTVNFTGSTQVGSIIASKAGKELKPVLMELGGKASAIVCEDANLENAAMQVALGSFFHAGQICMSTERILVHRSVLDQFATMLRAAADKVYAPSQAAPVLVAKAGVEKNQKLRKDATSKGAKVLYGDLDAQEANGYSLRPIIIEGVTKSMDLFYTESFGPTVSLIAVDSDEEAIEIANDTEYGLSGAVFTESLGRGLRIAKEIDSGAVHINSMSVQYVAHLRIGETIEDADILCSDETALPHGGVKKSGWGRFNAQWGMESFLKLKTVTYIE